MSRYQKLFKNLAKKEEIAFIPFTLIGDPDLHTSMAVVESLIAGGADALELGIPFSDPVADGPTIQAAGVRARLAGVTPGDCFSFLKTLRSKHPDLPIGLLVYVNLVFKPGLDYFYQELRQAGVDSVLIADVPIKERVPFQDMAIKHGVEQVWIAPPNASKKTLEAISKLSQGYTYVVTRSGVTGSERQMSHSQDELLKALNDLHAAPPVLGFGISQPEHVRQARMMGAKGAISGSAVVQLIEKNLDNPAQMNLALRQFVAEMKAATH